MNGNKKIAILGSGPISLFEAIYQSKLGNKVVVYESRKRYGGAWSNIKFDDHYDLELGCHIWDVDECVYSFLSSFLGENLKPVKPKPKVLYKNNFFPYDWKNNVFFLRSLKKALVTRKAKQKHGKLILHARPYKYPKGGSLALMTKLLKVCELNGVDLRKNVEVDVITENSVGWTLNSSCNSENFNDVILTSFSSLKEVEGKVEHITPKFKKVVFTHIHFVIEDQNFKKKISYLRVMDHQFIHRISDLSDYSKINNNKIIAVGVFKDKIDSLNEEEVKLEIEDFLKQTKIISAKAKVIDSFENDYKVKILENAQIKTLRKMPGIKILKSNNLIHGIRENLDRWEMILT